MLERSKKFVKQNESFFFFLRVCFSLAFFLLVEIEEEKIGSTVDYKNDISSVLMQAMETPT